jgi:hypothetical protein
VRWREQALNNLTIFQMALHNFVNVGRVDKAVPSAFRVDHGNGSASASIKATCFVHANLAGTRQTQFFDAGFAMVKRRLCALKCTTRFTIFSFVETEENVMLIVTGILAST